MIEHKCCEVASPRKLPVDGDLMGTDGDSHQMNSVADLKSFVVAEIRRTECDSSTPSWI